MTRSLLAVALFVLAGCSSLIDPDAEPTRCFQPPGGPNPCDPPLVCAGGFCVRSSGGTDGGVGSRLFGAPCSADNQCRTSVCVPADALRVARTGGETGFCARACCDDRDCSAPSVCFASGTGAKVCIPAPVVGLTRGTAAGGTVCTSGSECTSGTCTPSGTCLQNCTRDGDCSGGLTCKAITITEILPRLQLGCTTSDNPGGGAAGSICANSTDCLSGSCRFHATMQFCGGACGTEADCGTSLAYCGLGGGPGAPGTNTVPACVGRGAGSRRTGERCGSDADCFDNQCVNGACADACCSNSQCVATFCKPVGSGSAFRMLCVP